MNETTIPSAFSIAVKGRLVVLPSNVAGGYQVMQSPMLSREEAADYAGLGINAFAEFVRAGTIPKRTRGHRPYHVDDLDDFLNSGEGA